MGLRLSLLTLLAACALSDVTACSSSSPPLFSPLALPAPLPDTPVATLSGEATSVARVVEGRVALVSLWATWCDACAKEMDSLNRLDAKAASPGLERNEAPLVIGVAIGEEREKVATFARRRGLRYVQLVDEGFVFADALGQRRLPATLVVDRRGRVVFRGDALDAAALDAMRKALAETAGGVSGASSSSP